LLAALSIQAKNCPENASLALGLARADEFEAAGKPLDAMTEVTRVYEAGAKVFDG
jgi:hypothetical protein